MADSDRRLVWSSPDHAIVEHGPKLEFSRRLCSDLWILVPLHLFTGGLAVGSLFSDEPWMALMCLPLWIVVFIRIKPDPLGIGAVRPLATLDRRLGVIDLGMHPVARLDEIEASLVHDAQIGMDAIEIRGPDLHVRIVELPTGTGERLAIELRALGLPMRGDAASYRSTEITRTAP